MDHVVGPLRVREDVDPVKEIMASQEHHSLTRQPQGQSTLALHIPAQSPLQHKIHVLGRL